MCIGESVMRNDLFANSHTRACFGRCAGPIYRQVLAPSQEGILDDLRDNPALPIIDELVAHFTRDRHIQRRCDFWISTGRRSH